MNPARYRLISHDKGEWKLKSPMLTITTLVFEQPPSTITRYGKNEPVIRAESYPRDGQRMPFQRLSNGLPFLSIVHANNSMLNRSRLTGGGNEFPRIGNGKTN